MAIVGFIVLGDRTSHGGQVIECTSIRYIDGLRVARLGDLVWCPRCNRVSKIVTSRFPQVTDNGLPSAFDMDLTDCGAALYSRHNDHAGYGAAERPGNGTSAAKSHTKTRATSPENAADVQEHFVLNDCATGPGIAGPLRRKASFAH